jgi:hypothetical protein
LECNFRLTLIVLLYIGLSVMSVQINQVGYCHTGLL